MIEKILKMTFRGIAEAIWKPGLRFIKLFSCSAQLSTKFQLLIKTKIRTNEEVYCFMSLRYCINHANKCKNANIGSDKDSLCALFKIAFITLPINLNM